MKLAFLSDIHLGDTNCCMFKMKGNSVVRGKKFEAFMDSVGRGNDYLVLMGDILDFAISKPFDVYRLGQKFFQTIKDEGIAREIIYIMGNHDFNFWETYEQQINVIHQIDKGSLPTHYRWALPGFLLDQEEDAEGITLPGVSKKKTETGCRYGGLFLDKLTVPPTCFNIIYPNLYILTEKDTTLITHGHYFEEYWAIGSDWFPGIFGKDLNGGNPLAMKDIVGVNLPLCQLSSSGLGLAGPLTEIIGHLEHQLKDSDYTTLKTYLDNFRKSYVSTRDYHFLPGLRKYFLNLVLEIVEYYVLKKIEKVKPARNNKTLFEQEDVIARFWKYYDQCQEELKLAKVDNRLINTMIMGHTHVASPWESKDAPVLVRPGNKVPIYNTGGWLDTDGEFVGAAIFHYETGKGFSSISIT